MARNVDVAIRAFNETGPGIASAEKNLLAFQATAVKAARALSYGGIGLGGGLPLGLGAFAGAAVALKVGKTLVDDYRDHQKAVDDLTQAYQVAGLDFGQAQDKIEAWITANAPYIQNVNDAREGFATLTRVGLTQADVLKAMNDALNLAALKHIDLSQAVEITTKLTQGQAKGLIDYGVHLKGYDDVTGQAIGPMKTVAERLGDGPGGLGAAVKGGTKTIDDLQKAQDKFGLEVDKLATDVGPALVAALAGLVEALNFAANLLRNVGAFGTGGIVDMVNEYARTHPQKPSTNLPARQTHGGHAGI